MLALNDLLWAVTRRHSIPTFLKYFTQSQPRVGLSYTRPRATTRARPARVQAFAFPNPLPEGALQRPIGSARSYSRLPRADFDSIPISQMTLNLNGQHRSLILEM